MATYEIMLIIDGSLDESKALEQANVLKKLLAKTEQLEFKKLGLKDLAYDINKKNKGFYFLFNFKNEDAAIINEFRRVCLLTKAVLRHLIINLEKDYGYKWLVNPKKIEKSEFRAERYKRIKATILDAQEKAKVERDTSSVRLTDI
ncbi:MAG: 30S ribosomal protein S6 [Malacoplasma sp.]